MRLVEILEISFLIYPFTEPSPTLFTTLMGFVVQAGQKFAAITDSKCR